MERDANAKMLSDTTVALHQLQADIPGKEAKARKEGKQSGFKSGFTWGMVGTTAVAIIVKIAQSLK